MFRRQSALRWMLLGMRPSRIASASKLSARASAPLASVSFLLLALCFPLVIVPGHGPVAFSGLRVKALSDLEERVAADQKAHEIAAQLAMLTAFGQALCDTVLGADQGNAQLALHLDEARLQVDPLISEGVHCGVLIALTSVGSHYDGIDYDAVGQGYASKKSDDEILAIVNSAAHGAEILASKVSAASIRLQYQAPGA